MNDQQLTPTKSRTKIKRPPPERTPTSSSSDSSLVPSSSSPKMLTLSSDVELDDSTTVPAQPPPLKHKKRAIDIFGDRYIPKISPPQFNYTLTSPPNSSPEYTRTIAKAIGMDLDSSVMDYSPTKASKTASRTSDLTTFLDDLRMSNQRIKKRTVQQRPERILDIPGILDDFYVHVLDWSSKGVVAVALGRQGFLWNEQNGVVVSFFEILDISNYITCLSFSKDGSVLAVGDIQGTCYLFDMNGEYGTPMYAEQITTLVPDPSDILTTLAWNNNLELAMGTTFGSVFIYNLSQVRVRRRRISAFRVWKRYHTDRIVTITWDPTDERQQTLATGGNDDLVIVWNSQSIQPKHILREHTSAIRALAFCPWQKHILATGGGSDDKHLRIFNTETGVCIKKVDVGSQVCSIIWSISCKELISSQARDENQLIIWSYPSMTELCTLPGHGERPLYMALSPNGQHVCSASADENLKFWKCFEVEKKKTNIMDRMSR